MGIPRRLIEFLEDKGAFYERITHPERFTAQELADVEEVKGRHHAKVVMVFIGGEQVMTVLPSDRLVDLEKLEQVTGQQAFLADEEEFKRNFPDCEVGTMPPFGSLYGLKTYVDRTLSESEFIVFEAGTHTDAIKMDYRDYELLEKPLIEDFSVKLHPAGTS